MRGPRRIGGLGWPVLLILFQAATWFSLFTSETSWLRSWRQAVDNAVGTIVIVGPLLAGLVAGTYAALRGSALGDLLVASAHPVRSWFAPAVRLWSVAVLSLVLAVGALSVRSAFYGVPMPSRQLVILMLGVIVLGVHGLVGVAIGLRGPPRAAPVLAAFISYGLFLLAGNHLAPPSFETGGVTGTMYGEQYRPGSVAALCVFGVLSGIVLLPWVGAARPGRWAWAISAAAVVATIGLAQVTWPDTERRLEAAEIGYACGRDSPQVCVVDERPGDDLPRISWRLRELSAPLSSIGVDLPDRWRQDLFGHPKDRGSGRLIIGDREIRDQDLVRSLVEPAGCPQYPDGNEPAELFGARVQILNWLVFRNELDTRSTFPPWFSSTKSEAWVRDTYAQLKSCDLDAVRRP